MFTALFKRLGPKYGPQTLQPTLINPPGMKTAKELYDIACQYSPDIAIKNIEKAGLQAANNGDTSFEYQFANKVLKDKVMPKLIELGYTYSALNNRETHVRISFKPPYTNN